MKHLTVLMLAFLLCQAPNFAQATFIKDINTGTAGAFEDYTYDFVGFGNSIYFVAKDATSGFELWKSDGTAAGTVRVKDINPGTADSKPRSLVVANNKLFFTAQTATDGREVWVTDGTEAGTKMVKNILTGTQSCIYEEDLLVVYNNNVYFSADNGTQGGELWKSDGTEAGTVMVKDISTGFSYVKHLVIYRNKLYFFASGNDLYSTDGTAVGTLKVKSFSTTPQMWIGSPFAYNDKLYFSIGLTGYYSSEPWVSDGTDAGTKQLKDIVPGASTGSAPQNFYGFNNATYFDGVGLWKTDGTETGTTSMTSNSVRLSQVDRVYYATTGTKMIFCAQIELGSFSTEVWVTDGTVAGTKIVKYINSSFFGSNPQWFTAANGKVYFAAKSSANGRELWLTDGTEQGTKLAADVVAGSTDSSPENLIFWKDNLYFIATTAANGRELWKFAVPTPTKDLEVSQNLFTIAQNPVSQNLTINGITQESKTLTLTDVKGQIVVSQKMEAATQNHTFSVAPYANGLYFLKVQTDKNFQIQKVIVQH
jgi:ELWxxDGT repeat protein